MPPAQVTQLRVRRRRVWPSPDFGGFFVFFGISGTDWNREERLERRFEREYHRNLATLRLSPPPPPGPYRLGGLPEEAKRRNWTVGAGGVATASLSDEAADELRGWWAGGGREVLPRRLG